MGPPLTRKLFSRTAITRVASVLQWGGALLFVLYVYLEIRHVSISITLPLLFVVAVVELIAIAIERVCRHYDEAEIKSLQAQLDHTEREHEELRGKIERTLTPDQMDAAVEVLRKVNPQPIDLCVASESREAEEVCRNMHCCFYRAGWDIRLLSVTYSARHFDRMRFNTKGLEVQTRPAFDPQKEIGRAISFAFHHTPFHALARRFREDDELSRIVTLFHNRPPHPVRIVIGDIET